MEKKEEKQYLNTDQTSLEVLMIDDPKCASTEVAGGKGSMIHNMRRLFPRLFPNAFVIPGYTALTDKLLPYIETCVGFLGCDSYAVRSSASMEDMEQYSFAGQYLSLLNISGPENILSAAKEVRESMQRSRVREYLETRGLNPEQQQMSVLVMPMVGDEENTISGVIFSSDVESGLPYIYITAVEGLGEKEVSGQVSSEVAVMKPLDSGSFEVIRHKPRQSYGDKVFLLEDDMLKQISKSTKEIEAYMQSLQPDTTFVDIEYAIQDGRLQFVQARPDTVLKLKEDAMMVAPGYEKDIILRAGTTASRGVATGKLCYCRSIEEAATKLNHGDILFCENTSSIWEPLMRITQAIISKSGSSNCHTALVSRELKIPCLVGIDVSGEASALEEYDGKIITLDASAGVIYAGSIPESAYISAQSEPTYSGLDSDDLEQHFRSATMAGQTHTDPDGTRWIGRPNEETDHILHHVHKLSHDFVTDKLGWPRVLGRVRKGIFEVQMNDIHRFREAVREFSPEQLSILLTEWEDAMQDYVILSENFKDEDIKQWMSQLIIVNGFMNLSFSLSVVVNGQFEAALAQKRTPDPYFSRLHHCVAPYTSLSWAQQATIDYISLLEHSTDEEIRNYAIRYRITPRFSLDFEDDNLPVDLLKQKIKSDREQGVKLAFNPPIEEVFYPNDVAFQLIFSNKIRVTQLKESSHHQKFYGQRMMLNRLSDKNRLKNIML